jgi:hypothetical protein
MYRYGLVVGFGLGGGALNTSDCIPDFCGGAVSGWAEIGGMLNPRLALEFDGWETFHPIANSNGDVTANGIYTAALKAFLTNFVWIKGGLGFGHYQVTGDFGNTIVADDSGLAIMGAAGVELLQAANFALDVQLRLGEGFYSAAGNTSSVALGVGLNWY